jgi:pyridoxine 5'-phosphate synthase PdxJ
MTKLSVNINKIATLRNARGGETPSVTEAAVKFRNSEDRELPFIQDLMKDTLQEKMSMI